MIKISKLAFSYKRNKSIFSDLDLHLAPGHIYGLLGKNGTGKSTLLKLISGVLSPLAGEITTMGVAPSRRLPSMLADLYYLPEEIYTPAESMSKYARNVGVLYPNFSLAILEGYMNEFELDMSTKLTSLSLGQKKKAAIAFALACNTRLLIMDEPTNGLDIPSKSQFRRIISAVSHLDRTIIISTHQVRDLENILDSVLVVDDKTLLLNASIDNIETTLRFGEIRPGDVPLYEEPSLTQRLGVTASAEGEYCKVDIEMLFNAVVSSGSKISDLLNSNKR